MYLYCDPVQTDGISQCLYFFSLWQQEPTASQTLFSLQTLVYFRCKSQTPYILSLRTHTSVPKPLELISFRCKHHSPSLANPQNEYFFRCKGQTLLSIRCKHINPSIASPNHLIITIRCTNFSKLLQLPSPYYASLLPRNPVIKRKPARRIPPQVNTRSPALWATGTRWQSGWWRQRSVSSLTADSRRWLPLTLLLTLLLVAPAVHAVPDAVVAVAWAVVVAAVIAVRVR